MQHGQPAGDCIDCLQCVHVCPTGVDIRNGPNLGCIQCGLCIDACDAVMAKIGRPTRLIAYDTDINIKSRQQGKQAVYRLVRTRTCFMPSIIALVGGVMIYALATRRNDAVSVIHDRNPMFVRLSDGALRNGYTHPHPQQDARCRKAYVLDDIRACPMPTSMSIGSRGRRRRQSAHRCRARSNAARCASW